MSHDEGTTGITSIALLTPGNFDDESPRDGLEHTLDLFELGEQLGFDGAWIRQRHLEHGVGSAAVFLAAASQRTDRIELGTAVIPIGYESPFRLAEDLSLADVLSHGRLQVGVSAGTPPHAELIGDLVFDGEGAWRDFDLSYGRVERLLSNLRGTFIGDVDTVIHSPGNVQRPRLQPFSRGLDERIWYGGSSFRSISWAASAGVNLLLGNLTSGEDTDDYHQAQLNQIALFRREYRGSRTPRIAAGRVVLPTDSAGPAARERYRAFAAARHERTLAPHGERRILFSRDIVGTADDIVEILSKDPVLQEVDELRFELPYEFGHGDYEQIVTDLAQKVAPALGWRSALVS